ncbi:MAG: Rieske 2Fe-2S domain-containing protein [Chloroflexi bacterium]|nr:Rieske 2Fe-2S domain-containing protein [Chloroflexota bacterium]
MADEQQLVSRRRFLGRLSLALSGLAAAVVSVPIVAYLLSPLLQPPLQEWRDLGLVDNFRIGETVEVAFDEPSSLPWAGQTSRTAVWLRRTGDRVFTAYGLNCTHLGCPVNWRAGAELFLCPCHGGVYYADGSVAGGPPPRPLVRYTVRIGDAERVQVLTRPLQQTIVQG